MGSNTGRLVIFRLLDGESWFLEDEIREVVRLRAGMDEDGMSSAAMHRGIAVLRLFRHFCDSVGVDHVIATATSAVRDAANGPEFLARAHDAAGWTLRVLSPADEARYGALGLLAEVPMDDGLVVDIGGGSAQVSRVVQCRWQDGTSFPLGALRLTEAFLAEDPPSPEQVDALRAEIRTRFAACSWLTPLTEGHRLAGLGGSIRNLGYIEHARQNWPMPTLRGFQIERARVDELVNRFLSVPRNKRARIPGLNPDRADILPAGAIVLQELMMLLETEVCHTSVNGLREGLLLEHFFAGTPPTGPGLRSFSVNSLARRYKVRRDHADRVAHLALQLFEDFHAEAGLGPEERELLQAAAVLHDVGTVLGYHDHHHHSQSLVVMNGLPGFTARQTAIIALLTRYHRKGTPTPGVFRRLLTNEDRVTLRWLAAFLRVAEYLERGRNGNVTNVEVADWGSRGITLVITAAGDASVEQWDTERQALPLLESLVERRIRLLVA